MLSISLRSSYISLEFTSPNVLIENSLILAKDFAELNNPIYFNFVLQKRLSCSSFLVW